MNNPSTGSMLALPNSGKVTSVMVKEPTGPKYVSLSNTIISTDVSVGETSSSMVIRSSTASGLLAVSSLTKILTVPIAQPSNPPMVSHIR